MNMHSNLFICIQENMKDQFATDGGCQLYGHLELNKAAGITTFHSLDTNVIYVKCKHYIYIYIYIYTYELQVDTFTLLRTRQCILKKWALSPS
jgi:hypothetical protein